MNYVLGEKIRKEMLSVWCRLVNETATIPDTIPTEITTETVITELPDVITTTESEIVVDYDLELQSLDTTTEAEDLSLQSDPDLPNYVPNLPEYGTGNTDLLNYGPESVGLPNYGPESVDLPNYGPNSIPPVDGYLPFLEEVEETNEVNVNDEKNPSLLPTPATSGYIPPPLNMIMNTASTEQTVLL